MHILVLDTIHGGDEIGSAYREAGHFVDTVDVYRGTTPDALREVPHRHYDLVVAPVHLDPDHPLIAHCPVPVISHHEAVRQLLGEHLPRPMVEITGAQGKTTTAHALAHILAGKGVLHTSSGTYVYPARDLLWKRSITPASGIAAVRYANGLPGWLVAEVSLGVTGAGDLAIITSPDNYPFACGKKSALKEKVASLRHARCVLVAENIIVDHENVVHLDRIARCEGMQCTIGIDGLEIVLENPLFSLPQYRTPLMLAAAAAMILHVSPTPLNSFSALPGRMSVSREKDLVIVDNANSGTNAETTLSASRYARHCARQSELTLVIGQAEGDGAVCEGFSPRQICSAIEKVRPEHLIWVGRHPDPGTEAHEAEVERLRGAASLAYIEPSRGDLKHMAAQRLLLLARGGKRGVAILNAKKETAYMFADELLALHDRCPDADITYIANLEQRGLPKTRADAQSVLDGMEERGVRPELVGALDEYGANGDALGRRITKLAPAFALIAGVPHAIPMEYTTGVECFSVTNGPRQVAPLHSLGHRHVLVEIDLHPKTLGVRNIVESEFGAIIRSLA
jgi:coenzyme F430 synthetase